MSDHGEMVDQEGEDWDSRGLFMFTGRGSNENEHTGAWTIGGIDQRSNIGMSSDCSL